MFAIDYKASWKRRRSLKSASSSTSAALSTASVWSKSREQTGFLLRALRATPTFASFTPEDLSTLTENMHCEEMTEGSVWTPCSSFAVIETGCYEDEVQGEMYLAGRIIQTPSSVPPPFTPSSPSAFAFPFATTCTNPNTTSTSTALTFSDTHPSDTACSTGLWLRVLQSGRIWVLPEATLQDFVRTRQVTMRTKALVNVFPALKALSMELLMHISSLFEERSYRQGDVILNDLYSCEECAVIESGMAAVHVCRSEGGRDDQGNTTASSTTITTTTEELAVMGPKTMIGCMPAKHGGAPHAHASPTRAFLCAKENNTCVSMIQKSLLNSFLSDEAKLV